VVFEAGAPSALIGSERRLLLEGVSWAAYVALRDSLDRADRHVSLTYLDGQLELVTKGQPHEENKSLIGRLLETWALERRVDLRGFGEITVRRESRQRALEPDECYTLGPKSPDDPPQIAIEVIVTRPLLDKLEVYAGLDVAEVWTWIVESRELRVYRLEGGTYVSHERSALLPDVDVELLGSFVRAGESHTELALEYLAALRGD
jgi:Uma2 family endonuclease